MFLWSIALQYLIYIIYILLISHHIRYNYLFAGITPISCVLTGWVYSVLGIFTALIAIGMLMLTSFFFSASRQQLVYALPCGLLTSLLGDHLTSIGDFFVLKSVVVEPGNPLQYFHIALSALLSALLAFCFKKSLGTWLHAADRRMIGTVGTLILFTYYIIIFYTRFSGETPDVLALSTSFFILYLCVGLIILVYHWKISNRKLADQLLEQQVRMQQDYIKDLEKNYQNLREFKHDYQNLLFSFHGYIVEGDSGGLWSYYDQTILLTHQMMNLFPVNLSTLDNMKVPEIHSLLSLKLMMAQEKGLIVQLHPPKPIEWDTRHAVNLVRMFSIILGDAIEGVNAVKKKKIELTIIKRSHSVMIRIINTTTNTLPLNQSKQKGSSTKADPRNEGLGLFILDESTKTNPYPFLETSIENQRFSQTIYIQIK